MTTFVIIEIIQMGLVIRLFLGWRYWQKHTEKMEVLYREVKSELDGMTRMAQHNHEIAKDRLVRIGELEREKLKMQRED